MQTTRCFSQAIPADLDMKAKVETVLSSIGFDKKRARAMDVDDFLK